MAIVDIRGGNGAGKSFIMHTLLEENKHEPILDLDDIRRKHLGYYLPDFDAAIIGRYTNVCGGCDGVGGPQEVVRRIRTFSENYTHTLLEGIIVSHAYKRYRELALELQDRNYNFLFLNTPIEVCLKRVHKRRKQRAKETGKEPRPLYEQGIYDEFNKMVRIWNKMLDAQELQFEELNYKDPMTRIYELLSRPV